MSDAPRRLLILLGVFVVTAGGLMLVRDKAGGYGLFDLLRGRPAPRADETKTNPEHFTLPEGTGLSVDAVPTLAKLSMESAEVAERVLPSVVSITTAVTLRDKSGRSKRGRLLGAGIIVTPEGHVITANHVVRNFDEIVVRLADDRQLDVEVVRENPALDIAVLKIISEEPGETFPALPFVENSDAVRQGEFVFSFGNPHGLSRSSDFGIISSRERSFTDGSADLFQTSFRLLPGHSGGPLVNVRGEIVGVNRANFGPDPSTAVGMAIVANDARDAMLAMLNRGKPIYGYLGVHVEIPGVYNHLSAFDVTMRHPVQVNSVTPGSAAEAAGLERGDIIAEFDDQTVDNFDTFKRLVRKKLAGEEVSITVRRKGEPMELKATMAELDSRAIFAHSEGWTQKRAADYIRRSTGAEVTNLSAAVRQKLGLPAAAGGIVVNEILPRTPASGQLRTGDIIEVCNGFTFRNAREFVALLDQRPHPAIDLLVMRPQQNGVRSNLMLQLNPREIELEPELVAEPEAAPAADPQEARAAPAPSPSA